VESDNILTEIAQEIKQCRKCILSSSRKNAVPGEGPSDAEIMLIGEGPGFHENEQGRPFVGQAGKFLNELLERSGLRREDVYITNVIKCRPPGNRDPQDTELVACAGYLERQIAAIDPLIILTLGRFSMVRYFQAAKISVIHGRTSWVGGRLIVPMYHPAAGLHQPSLKPDIIHDFSLLPDMVEKARSERAKKSGEADATPEQHQEDATQLSFF
jgi:DNA polymerase